MVCVSDDARVRSPKPGTGLSLSVTALDSILTVWSQVNSQEVPEPRTSESVMEAILDLVSEPTGSKELGGDRSKSKPRVGMRSRMEKRSCSYPKIADSRNFTYDEMIEYQEKLNNSDDFQFDIDDVEKKF